MYETKRSKLDLILVSLIFSFFLLFSLFFLVTDVHASNVNWVDTGSDSYINGKVGIGTTTPSSMLDVFGQLRVNNSPNSDILYLKGGPGGSGSTAGFAFDATGSTFGANVSARINFVDDNAYGAHILFENRTGSQGTTTTEKMRITTAGLVGIATTSPATVLDVNGYITTRSVLNCGVLSTDSTGKIVCGSSSSVAVSFDPLFMWIFEFFVLFFVFFVTLFSIIYFGKKLL